MPEKAWYRINSETPQRWKVYKLDDDYMTLKVYDVAQIGDTEMVCTCPAGNKSTCRHRKMIQIFKANAAIDTGAMYQHDTEAWREPPEVSV